MEEKLKKSYELLKDYNTFNRLWIIDNDILNVRKLLNNFINFTLYKNIKLMGFNQEVNKVISRYNDEVKQLCINKNREDLYYKIEINDNDDNTQIFYKVYCLENMLYEIRNNYFQNKVIEKFLKETFNQVENKKLIVR